MNTPDSGTQAATPEQQAESAKLSTTDSNPMSPSGYELLEEVGRGGMGVVYRARQLAFDRDLAIKFLRDEFDADSETARKFLEEARITAQLQHPGIPPIYEIGTLQNGRPFIAMKLVKGRALNEIIEKKEPFDSLAIFEPIAQALGYAHSKHVIHRDLKPQNVMVGAFGEVQLMDWGLAKVLGSTEPIPIQSDAETGTQISARKPEESNAPTEYGSVKGTPAYMAPEQALGAVDRVSERSDVFGLGGILCALLTGKSVFMSESGSAQKTRELAAQGKVEDAYARLDQCGADADVIALAKQCLSVAEANRPATGNAVAALVAKLRADAIERAKLAEIAQAREIVRATEARRRQRLILVGATALAIVLGAGIVGTLIGLLRAREQTVLANQQTELAQTKEREADSEKRKATDAATLANTERRNAEAERARALKERDRADRIAEQSAKVLDRMTAAIADDYSANQKPLTPDQKKFLEESLNYYEALIREGEGDDLKSQRRIGDAAFRLAMIENSLGRLDESRTAYEKAIAIQERLVREQPDVPNYQSDLALSYNNLSLLQSVLGQTPDAKAMIQRAILIQERLGREQPRVPDYQAALSLSYTNLGVLSRAEGDGEGAKAADEKALAIREQLVRDHPDVLAYQSDLAKSYNNLGVTFIARGDFSGAKAVYEKAIAIQERLVRQKPGVLEYQSALVFSQNNLGNLLSESGDRSGAKAMYDKAIVIQEELVRQQPGVSIYQEELARCYNNLGAILDAGEAKPLYEKAILIRERLVREQPDVPNYQSQLSGSYNNLALMLIAQGNSTSAKLLHEKAIAIRERLVVEQPNTTAYRDDLATSYFNLGLLLRANGERAEAMVVTQKAIAIREQMVRALPDVLVYQFELANCYFNLGLVQKEQNEFAKSVSNFDLAIELYSRVLKRDPANIAIKTMIWKPYYNRAVTYQNLARFSDATTDYNRAIALADERIAKLLQVERDECEKLRLAAEKPRERAPAPRAAIP